MRSFVAISLSGEAKEDFARAQRVLTVGRPVLEDNLHLTLVFLDDQPEEILEALHEELLALSAPSFSITFSGVEFFGRALAVGVEDCQALTELHRKVQTATRRAGIVLPRRRFRPHVTIARLNHWQDEEAQYLQNLNAINTLPEMTVTNFGLYQSTLRPDGARHDALEHYILN